MSGWERVDEEAGRRREEEEEGGGGGRRRREEEGGGGGRRREEEEGDDGIRTNDGRCRHPFPIPPSLSAVKNVLRMFPLPLFPLQQQQRCAML